MITMTHNFIIDRKSHVPIAQQLYEQLCQHILVGRWPLGSALPPTRQLAKTCQVGRLTVVEAYQQLIAQGWAESRQGAGTYVSIDTTSIMPAHTSFKPSFTTWGVRVANGRFPTRPNSPIEIDFGFGRAFPHIFPYDEWRRLLARYLSTDDAMLSRYGSPAGFEPLREAIAQQVVRQRGVQCQPQQIVIVNGVQQAIDILSRLLLRLGDQVLVETPGFRDAYDLFIAHGAHLTPMPVGQQGFPIQSVPATSPAKLVFVTPANQFPKGGMMPLPERLALLAWARANKTLILEDDYDGALRYDGRSPSALFALDPDQRVVYVGSFSKILFPSLRLAYVVLPLALVRPFLKAKRLLDRGAPTLTQAAVTDFITEGHFDRHLRRLREVYGRRRTILVQALHTHLGQQVRFVDEPAGLHIMLYLADRTQDEAQLVQQAASVGVRVQGGSWYHAERPSPPSLLLGFTGLTEEAIVEGVQRLSRFVNH